jgi:5-formyltetrahydrofolate cyclo-ligase
LIVAGSVAVNREGVRIGKGGGYSDLEYAITREVGFVGRCYYRDHRSPLQLLEEDLPETDHDFRIDFVVIPDEVIPTGRKNGRPKGVLRDLLTEEKIAEIPILGETL